MASAYNFSFYPGRTDIPLLDVYDDDIGALSGWTGTAQLWRRNATSPTLTKTAVLTREAWASLDAEFQTAWMAAVNAIDPDAVHPDYVLHIEVWATKADTVDLVDLADVYFYGIELDGPSVTLPDGETTVQNVPVIDGTVNVKRNEVA